MFSEGEHCIAVQHNLTVVTDAPEMIRLCEENQLASINRSPLGRGLLTGKYTAASTFPDNDIRSGDSFTDQWAKPILENLEVVREVLTSGGCTLAQGGFTLDLGLQRCHNPDPWIQKYLAVRRKYWCSGPWNTEQERDGSN